MFLFPFWFTFPTFQHLSHQFLPLLFWHHNNWLSLGTSIFFSNFGISSRLLYAFIDISHGILSQRAFTHDFIKGDFAIYFHHFFNEIINTIILENHFLEMAAALLSCSIAHKFWQKCVDMGRPKYKYQATSCFICWQKWYSASW